MSSAKIEAQQEARILRGRGMSVRKIASTLGVSQGSVSVWVRDVHLTPAQRRELDAAALSVRRRFAETYGGANGLGPNRNREKKIERMQNFRDEASREFGHFAHNPLFGYGLGLYAGEGNKTEELFRIGNSDPRIIQACARFVELVSPGSQYTLSARLHPGGSVDTAIAFWRRQVPGAAVVTARVYEDRRPNAGSMSRGSFRPYGICTLYVRKSSALFHKTMRWIEMLEQEEVA